MRNLSKLLLYSSYLNTFGYSLFGPLYAIFVLKVGGSAFTAGATWSLYMLVAGFLMFFFSRFADRVYSYRKRLIVAGYFVLAFGALAFILVTDPAEIYLVQVVNAIGVGMLTPAWQAVYSKAEDRGREVREWALFDGVNSILIAIAAFCGGIYVTFFPFKSLFLLIFAIQIVAAFVSIRILRN